MANKLKYFIGNWKMFGNQHSISTLRSINKFITSDRRNKRNKKVVFCVPSTLILNFSNKLKNASIFIGGQNCHHVEKSGAFTGSVSSSMLKKSGAKYVILGHSENRNLGENNKIIKKKIKSALNQKLNVVFCIGETLKEKNKNRTTNVLKKQMRDSLDSKLNHKKILIAYEPVWSIGTGKILKLHELKKNLEVIKNEFRRIFKKNVSSRILYGGSVNNLNVRLFSPIKEIDGFLIGGASQSAKKFIDIIKNYYK